MSKFIEMFLHTYLVSSTGSQGWTEAKLNGKTAPLLNVSDTLTWRYNGECKFRLGCGERTQCPGVYLRHPVPGGYKYGDLDLQVGGVTRIGKIKYGLESRGTVLAKTNISSKLQTRPLVREGATN
jgi:hypothetical protein